MKTRHSFISNSSSSSFIIQKDENYQTIWDVALAMIPCREGYENNQELIEKVNRLKDNISFQFTDGVSFSSCNYRTFIHQSGDEFLISTCNNHNWHGLEDAKITHPSEDNESYILYDMSKNYDFYYLEFDVYARDAKHCSYCRKCFSDHMILNGKEICPNCVLSK